MLLQMSELSSDDTPRQRTEKLSKSVDLESTVGWIPGVTDWLTDKCRPVGVRGM